MNFRRAFVMIFADCAILLRGSLKVLAFCSMCLTSQISADSLLKNQDMLKQTKSKQHTNMGNYKRQTLIYSTIFQFLSGYFE